MDYRIRTAKQSSAPERTALFMQELLQAAMHDEGLVVESADPTFPAEERQSSLVVLAGSPVIPADLWSRHSRGGRVSPLESRRLVAILGELRATIENLNDPPEFAPVVLFIEKSIHELMTASDGQ